MPNISNVILPEHGMTAMEAALKGRSEGQVAGVQAFGQYSANQALQQQAQQAAMQQQLQGQQFAAEQQAGQDKRQNVLEIMKMYTDAPQEFKPQLEQELRDSQAFSGWTQELGIDIDAMFAAGGVPTAESQQKAVEEQRAQGEFELKQRETDAQIAQAKAYTEAIRAGIPSKSEAKLSDLRGIAANLTGIAQEVRQTREMFEKELADRMKNPLAMLSAETFALKQKVATMAAQEEKIAQLALQINLLLLKGADKETVNAEVDKIVAQLGVIFGEGGGEVGGGQSEQPASAPSIDAYIEAGRKAKGK